MKKLSFYQILNRIIHPFHMRKLQRNIRAWLPAAVKDARSVEAEFVTNWSYTLRVMFGA